MRARCSYRETITAMAENLPGLQVLLGKAREFTGAGGLPSNAAPLAGDGSDRKFYRITSGTCSFVGLISPRTRGEETDENDSYLRIGRHLHARGLPAPRILYADAQLGHFLLEDAGDIHLQRFAQRQRQNLGNIYRHVLLLLAAVHRKTPEGFTPDFCFDTAIYDASFLYERELEYFRRAFLNGCLGLDIGPDTLRSDFEALADEAGVRERRHVFHRDFQSRNIMVSQKKLWLIDFQGMRFGPPAYDLASLLVDPYVMLPRKLQEELEGMYCAAAGRFLGVSRREFLRSYRAVRLSRNLQILGAFGFLGLVKGKRQFLAYIPWAWDQLREWLRGPCRGRYPGLERLVSRIGAGGIPGKKNIEFG